MRHAPGPCPRPPSAMITLSPATTPPACAPGAWAALAVANRGAAPSYGDDEWQGSVKVVLSIFLFPLYRSLSSGVWRRREKDYEKEERERLRGMESDFDTALRRLDGAGEGACPRRVRARLRGVLRLQRHRRQRPALAQLCRSHHSILRPQPPHWPLGLMLVCAQAALGLHGASLFVTYYVTNLPAALPAKVTYYVTNLPSVPLGNVTYYVTFALNPLGWAALVFAATGLAASVAHPGQPQDDPDSRPERRADAVGHHAGFHARPRCASSEALRVVTADTRATRLAKHGAVATCLNLPLANRLGFILSTRFYVLE